MSILAINHNLMAANTADNLSSHYSRLATSVQRLSSGLRINSAADDAAGLAIRELQRTDIAALEQGVRNVNDAISLLQTMDGALGVIDEKLIRMKELAEQAATGTYNSTQRLMIDSEFQAMGSEIDRIANATDFNGVKLLTAKMLTWYTNEQRFVITNSGSIDNLQFSATNNATRTLQGINPNNYVNANNPGKTISVSLTARMGTVPQNGALDITGTAGNTTTYRLGNTGFSVTNEVLNSTASKIEYTAPNGWAMSDASHPGGFNSVTINNTTGASIDGVGTGPLAAITFSMNDANSGAVDFRSFATDYPDITSLTVDTGNNTFSITRSTVVINDTTADYTASYNAANQTVTVRLANGGTVSLKLDNPLAAGDTINFDLAFEGETRTVPVAHHGVDPDQRVKIHFGPGNDSAEDYYYINFANCTRQGLGFDDVNIQTQEDAQNTLVGINDAIASKDRIRAEFGAMQNRLENTLANISSQAENLQASESRISDADIAQEMVAFVRNQILTQSATAMLAQANSVPQMVMTLIN